MRYNTVEKIKNENPNVGKMGTPYYKTTLYPTIPLSENDIYIITDSGDRLDLLANQFYNDFELWWIISIANPNKINMGSIFIKEGTQLRIPLNVSEVIDKFNTLNNL